MPFELGLSLASAAAFLAIALLTVARRAGQPLALQLALMCVALFAYHMLEVVSTATGHAPWRWAEYVAASLVAIPTFRLFVGFLGLGKSRWWAVRASDAYFGAIALATLAPFARPELAWFPGNDLWAALVLGGLVPGFAWIGYQLARHVRRSTGRERARAELLSGALLLGVGSVTTDLAATMGADVPRLSYFGLVVSAFLVAALVLTSGLFERPATVTIVNTCIAAVLIVLAQLVAFSWAGANTGLVVLASVVVVVAVLAVLRPLMGARAEQRARARYLATLGRFAEQMAHDLRNPLAAIRGAAQFLKEERAQGRSMDAHEAFVDLIVERSDRIERVVREYQRIGRVELAFTELDVNELVSGLIDGASRSGTEVAVGADLARELPVIAADRDLLAHAIENLLRNAHEAMPQGGELRVSTEHVPGARGGSVRVRVRDTGVGMNVRTQERALEEFFTTKADGTGLGLVLVGRVIEAHGGTLSIESDEGRGTTVSLDLPVAATRAPSVLPAG